jgi:hypothetical protein
VGQGVRRRGGLDETDKFKDPQITWHQAYYDLADGQALTVEFTSPAASTG